MKNIFTTETTASELEAILKVIKEQFPVDAAAVASAIITVTIQFRLGRLQRSLKAFYKWPQANQEDETG